jgi:RNA polymerase sigma factor (sigma-70 family)
LNQHPDDIVQIINGCKKNQREAQKTLYKIFYSYSMGICMRYSNSREDAVEIMNDGFMKIFTYIRKFDTKKAFLPWLRKIMINNSIDHFNKYKRQLDETELAEAIEQTINSSVIDSISYDEMLELVRKLPPAYRVVFNLIAIEGYKHHEVAELLGISIGTSKSNYARAKKKLQEFLFPHFEAEG